jgi:hypothetical protein
MKNRQNNGQKKKVQNDKHWSTKHTYKTKYRVTRPPLKFLSELKCSGRVSSSCSRYTDSDYPCGIFWPLFCLFFIDIRILITPLVSVGHCFVCSSSIYGFWLTMVNRYQRGNQNPYIDEEQTKQWSKDTTGVIRIRISMKNRQNNGQQIPKG